MKFLDLVFLRVMIQNASPEGVIPGQNELYGQGNFKGQSLVNDWIEDHGVSSGYAEKVRGRRTMADAVQRLLSAGLIQPVNPNVSKSRFELRGEAYILDRRLPEDWRKWPLTLPVEDGKARWDQAIYMPEL